MDVEYTFDDPDEGWFGAAEPADDTDPDTDRWFVPPMDIAGPVQLEDPPREVVEERPVIEAAPAEPEPATTRNVVPTRRDGFVRAAAPASWESRLSNSGAWDFKATSNGSRLGSRAFVMAAAIIAGAAAVVGAVLVLRSPAPAVEDSTTAPPSQSAPPPAPTKSTPVPSAELPPPLPPPAPPPSAEQIVPGVTRQYNPNYQTPDEPRKPQTNVTRTPMSATPPAPPRQTDQGRATPGESGHHGFFG